VTARGDRGKTKSEEYRFKRSKGNGRILSASGKRGGELQEEYSEQTGWFKDSIGNGIASGKKKARRGRNKSIFAEKERF